MSLFTRKIALLGTPLLACLGLCSCNQADAFRSVGSEEFLTDQSTTSVDGGYIPNQGSADTRGNSSAGNSGQGSGKSPAGEPAAGGPVAGQNGGSGATPTSVGASDSGSVPAGGAPVAGQNGGSGVAFPGYPAQCTELAAIDAEPAVPISSAADLAQMGWSKHYILINDITLPSDWSLSFTSAATLQNFVLDGNGHTVAGLSTPISNDLRCSIFRNLVLESPTAALVEESRSSVFQNIVIRQPSVVFTLSGNAGGISGVDAGSLLAGVSVNGGRIGACGAASSGGLIGVAYGSSIAQVSNSADVLGGNSGGIVGIQYSGTVSHASNTGTVEGREMAGGVVGIGDSVTRFDVLNNSGIVRGGVAAGGFFGSLDSGGTILSSSSSGSVWGAPGHTGGVWGSGNAVLEDVIVNAPLHPRNADVCN